jgi:hypothetical protein
MHAVSFVLLTLKWRLTTRSALHCLPITDCFTKNSLADVSDLMVLTSVDSLRKYKYDSDLAIFPAFAIFFSSTLLQRTIVRNFENSIWQLVCYLFSLLVS